MGLRNLFRISGTAAQNESREAKLYRALLRHEAKIGGELFGPLPPGGRREFFCLDEHTWIWHEEWLDDKKNRQARTTRYDVRPDSIVKSQNGKHYQQVSLDEAKRLQKAVELYQKRVATEIYKSVAPEA